MTRFLDLLAPGSVRRTASAPPATIQGAAHDHPVATCHERAPETAARIQRETT